MLVMMRCSNIEDQVRSFSSSGSSSSLVVSLLVFNAFTSSPIGNFLASLIICSDFANSWVHVTMKVITVTYIDCTIWSIFTYHMIKIWNNAGLSYMFDFFNVSVLECSKKFASTTTVVTSEKTINPRDINKH